jgi:hypothetical protein
LVAEAANKAPSRKAVVVTLPATTKAVVGMPVQLVALVRDKSGKPVSGVVLTWASADAGVATVNASGVLTPLRAGSTTRDRHGERVDRGDARHSRRRGVACRRLAARGDESGRHRLLDDAVSIR